MNWKKLLVLALVALCATYAVRGEGEGNDDGVEVEDEPEEAPVEPVRERPRYKTPVPKGSHYLAEPFDSKASTMSRWVQSQAKKDNTDEAIAKYDGKWEVEEAKEGALLGDLSLVLKSKAKHHAVSALLDKPYEFKGKPFIVQYEVKFQNGIDCGGAYVKLLSKTDKLDLKGFHDKTPYTVMFGPDKCGMDHKLHFIFRHKNPKTGEFEEKHAKKPSGNIDSNFSDRKTHLYTLIVNPDNSFEIRVDNTVVNSGSLLADVSPAVNPAKEIDDPKDKKPETWDEREKIPDPDAKKPDDWDESEPATITDPDATKPEDWLDDEPLLIPDPDSEKPGDWDDEMDGEWEAPKIDNPKCASVSGCGEWAPPKIQNPKYKGKWSAPMIDNPNYQGIWKPKRIPNPNYFEDLEPYKMTPINAVGLELWSMTEDILFDNFLVTDDVSVAEAFAADSWALKHEEERAASSAGGVWHTLKSAAEERPWLWAVYVVVLLLPVVLLSICLCPKSGPVKPEDIAAERKKTDEATPDDEVEEEEDKAKEEKEEKDVGAGGDNATAPARKSKAALEATEGDEDEAEDEGEEADAEDEEQTKEEAEKKSPRRRKPRKD